MVASLADVPARDTTSSLADPQASRCYGQVSGANLLSEPYEYRYGREGRVLTRPSHGWQFDIEGRRSMFDSSVRVENGEIMLTRQRSPRRITIILSSGSSTRLSCSGPCSPSCRVQSLPTP